MTNFADPRQVAFLTLQDIEYKNILADVALDRSLRHFALADLDKKLATELVYGCVRRRRSLDALIDVLAKKKSQEQPPPIRILLHIGLYQLRYLSHIPPSAAVNTTVELTKFNNLGGLSGFVNGLLRQYTRLSPLRLTELITQNSSSLTTKLGLIHSYPDWIVSLWLNQLGESETIKLAEWYNQSPTIDIRINPLKTSLMAVETAMRSAGLTVSLVGNLPQALRLYGSIGNVQNLPGFAEGWWTIQDSSGQLVTHLLDPQPGETIVDLCAAPGGKTTHIAELMGDQGIIWACDRTSSRLQKLRENMARLDLTSIRIYIGDSREFDFLEKRSDQGNTILCDRLLLDAPCSGLGTLHRRADARWRHTLANVKELAQLQSELLAKAATLVKVGGVIVYATCTLHPAENEQIISAFLEQNPDWKIDRPDWSLDVSPAPEGWIKVWPHHQQMDGFFMVRLKNSNVD